MRAIIASLTLLASAAAALAQDTNAFRAYSSYVDLIEGGRVPIVVLDFGDEHVTMRSPRGFGAHIDTAIHGVRFEADSGAAALTIMVTTNSPGALPAADDVKGLVLARHPGAWVLQTYSFPTSYKPGLFVDLAQAPAANISLRTRHGFAPAPKGCIEFIFAANDADYDKLRVRVMQAIGTITVETVKEKAETE